MHGFDMSSNHAITDHGPSMSIDNNLVHPDSTDSFHSVTYLESDESLQGSP